MPDTNAESLRYLHGVDIPEATVDYVLNRLHSRDPEIRFSQADWNKVKDKKPHLFHFIESASTEAAPEDPLLRAKVASALLGMVVLSEELRLRELEQTIDSTITDHIETELLSSLYPQEGEPV